MVWYIIPTFTGLFAGIIAGAIMGGASDIAFRAGLFRSSLFVVDGEFFARIIRARSKPPLVYLAGVHIHLVTSGVFGAVYMLAASIVGLPARSFSLVALYVFFLWLSMLFIALPAAGQGFLGKKAGGSTWLEQLLLHVLFFVVFYAVINLFGRASP